MDDGHMYDYDHLHRTVLLEHKYNFRLALMYSKNFLSTPDMEIQQENLCISLYYYFSRNPTTCPDSTWMINSKQIMYI